MGNRTCSIDGCDRPHRARGWCTAHHQNWRRYGSPYGKPAVPLANLPGERWMPIGHWEGRYEVSSQGRVRNARNGRMLAGWKNAKGYRMVILGGRGGEQCYVHHLVAEAFIGLRPPGQEVRHYPDRDPANNARVNLAYGTISQNAYDAVEHGTHFNGSKTHCGTCGRPYDEENTYWKPGGGRVCRHCSRAAKRRYKVKMRRLKLEAA